MNKLSNLKIINVHFPTFKKHWLGFSPATKTLFKLLFILLILISIPLTVKLSQTAQNLNSNAADLISCNNGLVCTICSPSSNTCSFGNGKQNCTYTKTLNGEACNPVTFTDVFCYQPNCSTGFSCVNQACISSSTATPTPTPTPIGPTPTPLPPTNPPSGSYLIIDANKLLSLPTSGAAWDSIVSLANASATPDVCNQDNKADINALAAGIVYARTGNTTYRTKAISLIRAAMQSQRDGCGNAVLALGRQLGGYVMAADFANFRESDWITWLSNIRNKDIGGHGSWHVLRTTSDISANNWGTFALASIIAADRFLGDTSSVSKDWQIFSGYGVPFGWPFNKTSSWNQQWSCVDSDGSSKLPIGINPVGCTKSGYNLDGAPVEDSSRETFPAASSYIHESMQGYVVQAQLLSRAGYPAWTVNNSQVCRAAQFANRMGRLNDFAGAYYVAWMANEFCGLSLPTRTPTSGGRIFGFADWMFP